MCKPTGPSDPAFSLTLAFIRKALGEGKGNGGGGGEGEGGDGGEGKEGAE